MSCSQMGESNLDGVFLKIPGYSKITLSVRLRSQFILQILLATPQPSNQKEFALSALLDLLNKTKKLKTSEATIETSHFFFDNNILILILSVLSSLTYHPHTRTFPHFNQDLLTRFKTPLTSHLSYNTASCGKGIGFGNGPTTQQWNAEEALIKKRADEEQIMWILEVYNISLARSN